MVIRFRGGFAYVEALDAFASDASDLSPVAGGCQDENGSVPVRLCRLGYLGGVDRWMFAFYKYSDDRYEPSVLPSGSFEGTPEQAFDCSASVYLAT